MNDTATYTQADVSKALELVFRDVINAATSSTPRTQYQRLFSVQNLQDLEECLVGAAPGVNLAAAFMSAVERLITHEPQSDLIEAQLDLGLMAIRHLAELSEGKSMEKYRTAASETNLRKALAWLDKVRASSSPITKPARTPPSLVPDQLSEDQARQETDLAIEIAVLFREAMRAMSANDRRGAVNEVLFSYSACRNLAGRIDHNYRFYPILERALEQFENPDVMTDLEEARLDLSRAGVRLLATATDPSNRRRGYASRLARDTQNFDGKLEWLNVELERRP